MSVLHFSTAGLPAGLRREAVAAGRAGARGG